LIALFWAMLACQTDPFPAPIPGTSYRIDRDIPEKDSEVYVDMMTTWQECAGAGITEMDACLPKADRGAGEMHLSFQLKDPQTSTTIYRSITDDQIRVTHDRATQTDVELIPHEPMSSGQLFILLIDGSGSMYENGGERIQKVYEALLMPSVVRGFFPEGSEGKSGVVLMQFSSEVRSMDGGAPRVIRDPAEYRRVIETHLLQPTGGFTHLYGAVRYGVTELLNDTTIRDYLTIQGAEPTFLVLTDGFNNEAGEDTCADNAPRLQTTIDLLREQRVGGSVQGRSTLYAVGLGKAIAAGKKPKSRNVKVTAPALCGQYQDRRIDSDLENFGIDAVSLEWLAEAGGGISFVKRNPEGLAEVFTRAARPRYRWYEVRYRTTDSLYHRKSFDVELELTSADLAVSRVKVYPSAWVDAPSGRRPSGEGWVRSVSFRESVGLLMMPLGILVFLFFWGPAAFNARRAITRRARPRR
jgi:hypothetical protein